MRLPSSSVVIRGFTLLEMLVVILLIGIAAAAVAVSVGQGLHAARINAAASELSAALRATRGAAVRSGHDQYLAVNIADRSYQIPGHAVVRLPPGIALAIRSAQEDAALHGVQRIRFFPDGGASGGRITLKSQQREWHINVSWLTGAVSIVEATR